MRPPSPRLSAAKPKGGSTTTKTPSCSKQRLKRGPWTPEEDELLSSCVAREGEGRWRTLPKRAGLLRCGKSCRLRWMNYLRPDVKRGHIAPDEEDLILRLHRLLGNRWSLIAGRIPGRTDNEIKNYWNTHLSKKLISQGIDPRTHKPLSTTTFDHFQQQLLVHNTLNQQPSPKATLSNHGHIGPSSAAALEHELCSSSSRIPPVPKVNWNYNWEVDAAAAAAGNNCQVDSGFDGAKEDDFNYTCTDEVFSSFLNSLINEDGLVFNEIASGDGAAADATPSTAASDTNNNMTSSVTPSSSNWNAPSTSPNDPSHEF